MLDPNPLITNVGVEPLSFSLVCGAAALPCQWGRNGAEMCPNLGFSEAVGGNLGK